ncbi:molybdate ABC transporter substrate-binding protein [Succinimonas amylolytica]|uniref:molybdate ABC transporter substrate-binding protein n=1 Tax=Succinimonas amylolytica TaxID=83769 RepID=UPI00036B7117|nr:molybdate ABC transporter substrate-binding protein [Succinimonas amylolytica]
MLKLKHSVFFIILVVFCFLLEAPESLAADDSAPVRICAVAQVYDALKAVQDRFWGKQDFDIESGSATQLYSRIANRELSCDIYIGNDLKFPQKYILGGLADRNSLKPVGTTKLALWSVTGIVDDMCRILKKGTYAKIGVSDPRLQPTGYAVLQSLRNYELDEKAVSEKFLYAANDFQTLSFVMNGTVMIGFVPYVLIKKNPIARKGSYCLIPNSFHEPLYFYSVLFNNGSKKKQNAETLRDFLLSKEVKNVFREYGID